jgi:transcriptional regulator with XRE-family HTH domain
MWFDRLVRIPNPVFDPITQDGVEAIGADIRRLRLAAGVTQRELEELAGLDQTTISRIERGLMPTLRLHRYARLRAAVEGRLGAVQRRPRRRRRNDDIY